MSLDQDNFQALRRLLALKRHEQPPPGFFDAFARRVISRLEADELVEEAAGVNPGFWEVPWLQRFLATFDRSSALAGTFGLAVCGLLLAGLICSVAPQQPGRQEAGFGTQPLGTVATLQVGEPARGFVSSTNGVMPEPLENSLFQQFRDLQAQPKLIRASAMAFGE